MHTSLVFVDVEGHGPAVDYNDEMRFEFGAVSWDGATFHGISAERQTFVEFAQWLRQHVPGQPIFVSDNPAYDWQFINAYFWRHLGRNPFGHSARRIGDFYAGLTGNFRNTQKWKRLRHTKHDHNPVNDARGNLEAFQRILWGER